MGIAAFFQSEVSESITINASQPQIADVLLNWGDYASWNPYIVGIEGIPEVGQEIEVHFRLHSRLSIPLRCTLTEYDEENMRMAWVFETRLPFFYSAVHSFVAKETGLNTFRFTQKETMRGILGHKQQWLYHAFLKKQFKAMNKSLKRRAEVLLA